MYFIQLKILEVSSITKLDNVQHNNLSLSTKKILHCRFQQPNKPPYTNLFILIAVLTKNTQIFLILLLTRNKEIDA